MDSGSHHYKQAEAGLKSADDAGTYEAQMAAYAAAQIHATLALAAVTADAGDILGYGRPLYADGRQPRDD